MGYIDRTGSFLNWNYCACLVFIVSYTEDPYVILVIQRRRLQTTLNTQFHTVFYLLFELYDVKERDSYYGHFRHRSPTHLLSDPLFS